MDEGRFGDPMTSVGGEGEVTGDPHRRDHRAVQQQRRSGVGTATGFGTSTIMIPVMVLYAPLSVALLFVGTIHLCGDIWKVLLFRQGFDWKLDRKSTRLNSSH
mgnify:CR=1 FL=1